MSSWLKGPRAALAVLTLLNLLNYLDRFVLSSLVESLKGSELRLTDTQLGALATGFILVYMLTSPIFGTLGDRKGRPRLLAAGVAIWSLATALGGVARSFAGLFAARASVGIGEALLADHFPIQKRGRVFAVFFAAIPIGAALGYALGGLVDARYGWRAAFFIAGIPGKSTRPSSHPAAIVSGSPIRSAAATASRASPRTAPGSRETAE